MATQLYFRNQAIGDWFIKVQAATRAVTPPVVRAGLYQDAAAINADSRNILHARQFFVAIKKSTPVLLDQAVSAIQQLQGLVGDVEVREDSTVKMRCADWALFQVSPANVASGFGGRFIRELPLLFFGEAEPEYL